MRTNAIIRIILFSIAILVLLTILAVGIAANQFMFRASFGSEATTASSGTADAAAIRKINIEWTSGAITIRPADVDHISFAETAADNAEPMVWVTAGDTLKISYTKSNRIHIGVVPDKDLLIEVPRDWSCTELEIDTASADVVVENLTIGKVDFDGASGEFDFRDCTVDTVDIDTASGDLNFCGSLDVLDCDAASADCEISLTNFPTRIEMDLASGDLDLTLPETCGFTANLEALSGKLDTDFEVSHTGKVLVSGDGSCRIDMSAMSGNVFIHKATEPWNCDH